MKTLARWSLKDYHRMINTGILAGRQVELLAGEIVEMSPEAPEHKFYEEELADYLRRKLEGKALVSEARPITLSDSQPEPDIAVVKLPRNNYRQRHPSTEDIFLLVEISNSSLAYDLGDKKQVYANAGIKEYWVLDLKQKQLRVFRQPSDSSYQEIFLVDSGKISPVAFPDVQLEISQFLN